MTHSRSFWFRAVLFSLLLMTEVRSEVGFFADYKGEKYRITKADGNYPLVILSNGKEVVPEMESMRLTNLGPDEWQAKPDWVFVDREKAVVNSTSFYDAPGKAVNNELHLKFFVESTVALKNVVAVLYVDCESGDRGCLVQNIGDMKIFGKGTVAFDMQLPHELGRTKYIVRLFTNGKELRHSLLEVDEFAPMVDGAINKSRMSNANALPAPYLVFPPRGVKKLKGKAVVAVAIDTFGRVTSATAQTESAKASKAVEEAVRNWRFIPADEKAVNGAFVLEIDYQHLAGPRELWLVVKAKS